MPNAGSICTFVRPYSTRTPSFPLLSWEKVFSMFINRKKQWPCKPGSVHGHFQYIIPPSPSSVIYPLPVSPPASIVLPSGSDGQPSRSRFCSENIAGIRELSTSGVHSTHVTTRLVVSYSTFSPLPALRRRLFSSALTNHHWLLPVR